jgi:hypothetical protein
VSTNAYTVAVAIVIAVAYAAALAAIMWRTRQHGTSLADRLRWYTLR